MKRILTAIAVLILGTVAGFGNALIGTSISGISGTSGLTCLPGSCGGAQFNLITDAGATCNGVADDGPAFKTAGDLMRAYQAANNNAPVTLIIPPGSTCLETTCPQSAGHAQMGGIYNLTIIGTGASVTQQGSGLCIVWTDVQDKTIPCGSSGGGSCPYFRLFNSSRAGDICVSMQNPSDATLFPVGRWVIVGGDGVQTNSFPPNYVHWEYAQISGNGNGQVCFTQPLVNAYPATGVADLHLGDCSNWSCGGPGSLNLLTPWWGGYFRTIGLTFDVKDAAEIQWASRTVINDNLTFLTGGVNCFVPSTSQTVIFNNPNIPCIPEADKEVAQIIVNGGSKLAMLYQSGAAIKNVTLNNGAISSFAGTPLSINCNNSTIDQGGGAFVFGNSFSALPESFHGVNCNLAATSFIGNTNPFFTGGTIVGLPLVTCPPGDTSYTGSASLVCNAIDVYGGDFPQWLSIGARMVVGFQDSVSAKNVRNADNAFTVTGVTQSTLGRPAILTILFSPDFSSSPAMPLNTSGTLTGTTIAADQATGDFTCTGCGPHPDFVDLNFPAAQHKPLYTYSNRTYTCLNNVPNIPNSLDIENAPAQHFIAGAWNNGTLTMNVITADTNPADTNPVFQSFFGQTYNPTTGAIDTSNPSETISLLHTGVRIINPTSTSGAQAGDSINPPPLGAGSWLTNGGITDGGFPPSITNGPAAQCPVINVIWQTTR